VNSLLLRYKFLIFLFFILIVAVAGTAFFVLVRDTKKEEAGETTTDKVATVSTNLNNESSSQVSWDWTGETWKPSSTPPACSEPLLSSLPVGMDKVTNVLYPGQTRGGSYKPHGGFRFDNSKHSDIFVNAPLDAAVTSGSRYIENGEVQYLFTFINQCGIAYRLDHLHTLSKILQDIANGLPEPQKDDSRTTLISPPVMVEQGDTLATAVGFEEGQNVFVDFGVYDLRSPNEASKNTSYFSTHVNEKEYAFYGTCWLNHYPTVISTKLKSLPASGAEGKTSDYC
jgi:hypothetical protein